MKEKEYYKNKIKKLPDYKKRVFKNPDFNIKKIKNIHISGACGKFMASISGLFKDAGFNVSVSDSECKPPMSIILKNLKLKCNSFDTKNLKKTDLLIVGNVCSPDFIEPKYARKNNIPQISGSESLEKFFIKNKKSIIVSGTHGKTTTTSLLINLFQEAKKKPGFLVGGVLQKKNKSYNLGKNSDYFIMEGDEYDTAYFDKSPKFLYHNPTITIITSVEFDHADIYTDIKDYRKSFKFLSQKTLKKIFIFDEIKNLTKITEKTNADIFTYGFDKKSEIVIYNVENFKNGQIFDLKILKKIYKKVFIPMSGKHNVLNSAVVFSVGILEKTTEEICRKGLKNFLGVKKRQEILYNKNNIMIIDDFAHHPTAVKTTLEGLHFQYPEKNIIAIFEPRSNTSRMKVFEKEYIKVFSKSKKVIISTPSFRHNDNKKNFINIEKLILDLQRKNINAKNTESSEDIFLEVSKNIQKGDLIVVMSNGDFGNLANKLANFLKKNK
jgi:UDP-N-acetylmuramate: L-alanyl-gamma-D-glutamyl-meso-diaminopimelate ligase